MSDYQNEDGEYLMTAAELRLEAELDALSAEEARDDASRYDFDWDVEPPVCGVCGEDGHESADCDEDYGDESLDDLWNEDAGMEFGLFGSEA